MWDLGNCLEKSRRLKNKKKYLTGDVNQSPVSLTSKPIRSTVGERSRLVNQTDVNARRAKAYFFLSGREFSAVLCSIFKMNYTLQFWFNPNPRHISQNAQLLLWHRIWGLWLLFSHFHINVFFSPFHTTYIILLHWFRLSLKNSLKGRIKSSWRRDRGSQKRGHSTHLFKGSRQTHHHTMQVLKRQWHRKRSSEDVWSSWRDRCIWFNRCLFKKSLKALIFFLFTWAFGFGYL